MEYKISVISVYNNQNEFDTKLKKSLEQQDIRYELIALDNTRNRFKSASEALNYGAKKATGDILVFSHQDISLKGKSELRRFVKAIESCQIGDIIGTQGVREKSKKIYSNITAGQTYDSTFLNDYSEELIEVANVDEGFFGMKRETFEEKEFDEVICNNWHLYCVERVLYARKNGHKVYVAPIQLHHYSYGRISISYMRNLKELCRKYRRNFKYIWTTCYKVRTNPVYINLLVDIWILNRKLRGRSLT